MSDLDLRNSDLEWPFLPCIFSASILSHDLGEQLLPTSTLFRVISVDLLFPFGTYDMPLHSVSVLLMRETQSRFIAENVLDVRDEDAITAPFSPATRH